MALFLLGVFLTAVGITGNAGGLLETLAGSGSFVPFAVAIGIGYYAFENTPDPERKPVRILIIGLALAVILLEYHRIITGLNTAWQAITSLQGGKITNSNVIPGATGSAVPGLPTYGNALGNMFSPTGQGGQSYGGYGTNPDITNLGSLGGYLTGALPGSGLSGLSTSSLTTTGYGNLTGGQINAESGGQQFDVNGQPLISSAGAIGTAQLQPATAQQVAASIGVPYSLSRLQTDQNYNLELGSAYMGQLLNNYGGNRAVALAAYNLGPNSPYVQQFAQTGDINVLPTSVQTYVMQGMN